MMENTQEQPDHTALIARKFGENLENKAVFLVLAEAFAVTAASILNHAERDHLANLASSCHRRYTATEERNEYRSRPEERIATPFRRDLDCLDPQHARGRVSSTFPVQ
jgi:hypothetical protein